MRLPIALAVALAALVCATAGAAPVPTRTCEQRIEAGDAPLAFPAPAPARGRIFAGPLALSGHFPTTKRALGPRHENGRFATKVGALVRAGRPVVLTVPPRWRDVLFVHYARTRDGLSSVRLEPCAPETRAFSYDGVVGPVTGFSGGFEVARPGCYPLDVRVAGARS